MKFARWVFFGAGVYGVLVTLPNFFLEERMGQDYPPPINHPEFYYGFAGLCLAWQLMFLVIGSDPVRFRPAMLPSIVEKLAFAIAVPILVAQGRVSGVIVGFASVDAVLAVLFAAAWVRTPREWPR